MDAMHSSLALMSWGSNGLPLARVFDYLYYSSIPRFESIFQQFR